MTSALPRKPWWQRLFLRAAGQLREDQTRWPDLHSYLTGEPVLTEAQRRAQEAKTRADAAYARGDDRAYGRALMDLQQAQIERLELGQ